MRIAAAVLTVVLGGVVATGCVPTPVPLVEPAAGCYRSARPAGGDLSYTGIAGVIDNSVVHSTTDGSCLGEVRGTGTTVLAANVEAARSVCRSLELRPNYDDHFVTLVSDFGWDLGPNAWGC